MERVIPIYTKRLGRIVAEQAKGDKGKFHVIHSMPDKWRVVAEGSARALRVFNNQSDAVGYARQRAETSDKGEVVVHEISGRISERIYNKL